MRSWKSGRHRWALRRRAVGSPVVPPTPARRAVFIFGQSNASGLMVASSVTNYVDIDVDFPAVQMHESTAGSGPADPPTFTTEGPRDLGPRLVGFGGAVAIGTGGVELSMGRELDTRTADTWFVGKYTIDGSGLVNHWSNTAYPTTGGSLIDRFATYIEARLADWSISSPEDVFLYFIQGEEDIGQPYATYLAALESMFTALRARLGNFRILIHRIVSRVNPIQNIRAAHEAFVAADTVGAKLTQADDLALRDTKHYADDSYATIGIRAADAIIDMVEANAAETPYVVAIGQVTVANSASALTLATPLPPHIAGDDIYVVLAGIGQNNYATPSGWTEVADSPQHDSASSLNARIQCWTIHASAPGTSPPTIADVGSDSSKLGVAIVVRGAHATPIDVTAGGTAASSTSVSIPGDTTTGDQRLIIAMAALTVDSNTPQLVFTSPTNASLSGLNQQLNYSSASGPGVGLAIITGRKAAAGAFSATTATLSTACTQAYLTLAIKPA